jgi:hypothetical protein
VSIKVGIVRLLATTAIAFSAVILSFTDWQALGWVREYIYLPGVLALLLLERLGVKFNDPIGDFSAESQAVLLIGGFVSWLLIISLVWEIKKRLWRRRHVHRSPQEP